MQWVYIQKYYYTWHQIKRDYDDGLILLYNGE